MLHFPCLQQLRKIFSASPTYAIYMQPAGFALKTHQFLLRQIKGNPIATQKRTVYSLDEAVPRKGGVSDWTEIDNNKR